MSEYKPLTCLPVLPLRGIVVFPGCVTHFDVGRSKSARAVEEAMRGDQMIFLVAQRDVQCDEPKKADLYQIGTVAYVRQILRLPGDNMRILVEGKYRAQLTDMIHSEPYFFARAMELDVPGYNASVPRTQALVRQAHQLFEQFIDLAVKSGQENLLQGSAGDDAGELADFIAQNATFGYEDKQKILETLPPVHRLELCVRMMAKELDILRLESEINDQVQQNVNQNQRDYYLREQLHVIREELGEDDDNDADSYRARIQALKLPKETEEKLLREVSRFARQQAGSAEAAVLRNYLDTILDLPWNKETKERLDVKSAAKILDEDHFGLEPVKKRILETLAVRQLAPELPGQILCLVGPPGVGKTSVAISIARALNRRLARPPQDLYRRHARPHHDGPHPGQEQKRAAAARRDRQARQRLQGRSLVGPAGGARFRAEFQLPRPLYRGPVRPLPLHVHHHRQHDRHHPPGSARPDGGHRARLVHG